MKRIFKYILVVTAVCFVFNSCSKNEEENPSSDTFDPKVGAWYFGGWSFPPDPNGYTFHISPSLVGDIQRKPIWGWREDSPEIMKQQIDLAVEAGIEWWGFCWYENTLVEDPQMEYLNTALSLFLEAPNRNSLEFCLLSCHPISDENWDIWCSKNIELMKNENYLKVVGRPMIVLFNADEVIASMGGAEKMRKAFEGYRSKAIEAGVGDPFIGAVVRTSPAGSIYNQCGFDFLTTYNNSNFGRLEAGANDFEALNNGDKKAWDIAKTTDLPVMPTLTVGYDMRPWATDHPTLPASDFWYTGVTAQRIAEQLQSMILWGKTNQTELLTDNLMVMYAWNEYGEGAWLTPSVGSGNIRLEYIKYILTSDK